jgi:basic membrane lipoprotein Med (substrate-binding protein (PBP1-ABC) superfamily)/DNA-binding SARP family transcriptional activator
MARPPTPERVSGSGGVWMAYAERDASAGTRGLVGGRPGVDYRILGPLAVAGRDVDLGPPKQRAVLAVLLLHAGELVPTERLVELVWGRGAPRTAAHSVQIYVSNLRRVLNGSGGDPPIVTRAPGYVLAADRDSVDAWRFERLVAEGGRQAERGDHEAAAGSLRAALGLWRGTPLAEFAYDDFAQAYIRRLEELWSQAVESLSAAELALGHDQQALAEVAHVIDADPLRERAREVQLLALYRGGRQADALRAYQRFRALLAEELGIDPSPGLARLHERILLQDPSLLPAPAGDGAVTRNPFKGLQPFDEADAADFFGRRALTEQLCAALAGGRRLLAVVGPSGSGKSSAVNAGLVPALRADAVAGSATWTIARMVAGADPLRALHEALAGGGRPLLVVIDQFEELFALAESDLQAFLHALVAAVDHPAGDVRVVVTLRADFYDRPLLHPGFAEAFTAGVVNVMPLTAAELEAAVVEPAHRVGLDVQPALVGELVADAVNQLGALPLFQYTLTELFDQRDGPALNLQAYQRLGGLRGAVSRRAETLYGALDHPQQKAAQQLFLRLVTLGEGTADTRRRAPVAELTALDLDPVDMAAVLERFARYRLLTFDRDPEGGHATVEVAHEALLDAWQRLRDWIDTHRSDLRRYHSLRGLAADWEAAGRHPDYLLSGSRLQTYDTWSRHTPLQLTATEQAFLRTSIDHQQAQQDAETARRAVETRLQTRARRRLIALFATVALLAAATTALWAATIGSPPPDVAVMFGGRGDGAFNDTIAAGLDRAVSDFHLDAEEVFPETESRLRQISADGVPLVVTTASVLWDAPDLFSDYPETAYAVIDYLLPDVGANAVRLLFAGEEGSFLVGAAAARMSQVDHIGFIGGVDHQQIHKFEAGFVAGARHINPGIEIAIEYLTRPPDWSGFNTVDRAFDAAVTMYQAGADVIYHAAGQSGLGLFEAAVAESHAQGRHLWAIGVDDDQYESVADFGALWEFGPGDWRDHILTSMVKRVDVAVYSAIEDYVLGNFTPGAQIFDLAAGGIDYARSGGYIDGITDELERLKQQIIAGDVTVPTRPARR